MEATCDISNPQHLHPETIGELETLQNFSLPPTRRITTGMSSVVGFVTSRSHHEIATDDRVLVPHLRARNIQAVPVKWGSIVPRRCQVLVFRSCHDYTDEPTKFEKWVTELHKQGITLLNSASAVTGNIHKQYLHTLSDRGVKTVPSEIVEKDSDLSLTQVMKDRGWQKIVVKPAVSVSGKDTFLVLGEPTSEQSSRFSTLLSERDLIVQPYLSQFRTAGEYSLVFFERRYSHAVLKEAASSDFRVQRRYGGSVQVIEPDPKIQAAAENVLSQVSGPLPFARVDGIEVGGEFVLSELELIEPCLFLRENRAGAGLFADVITGYLENKRASTEERSNVANE